MPILGLNIFEESPTVIFPILITLWLGEVIPSECKAIDLSPINVIAPLFVIFWVPPLWDIPSVFNPVLKIFPATPFSIIASSARIPTEPCPIVISPLFFPVLSILYIPEPLFPIVILPLFIKNEPALPYRADDSSPVNASIPPFDTAEFSE